MKHNPLTEKQNFATFLSILALATVGHLVISVWFSGAEIFPSLVDALLSITFLGLLSGGIFQMFSYYRPETMRGVILFVLPPVLTWIWFSLTHFTLTRILSDSTYLAFFDESFFYRVSVVCLLFLIATLTALFWRSLFETIDNQNRQEQLDRQLRDAELFKLRQQLQPHFLFNSLNSIHSLISKRPDEARKMIVQLSEFLRGTMKMDDQSLSELGKELEYLQHYLEIEQVRFGHRLQVNMDCGDMERKWKLPTLILQPLLENSIKFGLYGTIGSIRIDIHCWLEGSYLFISIENPVEEKSTDSLGTGFGLKSVQRRLVLIYGRTDLLQITAGERSFKVVLKIPQSND